MGQEDFTTWTETGVVAKLSQTPDRSTWTNLLRNDYDTLLYVNRAGLLQNFTWYFTFCCTAQTSATQTLRVVPFGVCEFIQDWNSHWTSGFEEFGVYYRANASSAVIGRLALFELYNTNSYAGVDYILNVGTVRYVKVTKTGTNLEMKIYSDPGFTILLDTSTLTLHANHNLPYLACPQSAGYATTPGSSGYVENLKDALVTPAAPGGLSTFDALKRLDVI